MSLLTPDSGLLFWMIVSFGIVFVILSKYGFPVIIKAVEQRKATSTTLLKRLAKRMNSSLISRPKGPDTCRSKGKAECHLERSLCRKGTNHRRSSPEGCRRNPFAGGRGFPAYTRGEGESNPRSPFRNCRPFDRHSRESDERKDQPRQGTTTNHRPAVG